MRIVPLAGKPSNVIANLGEAATGRVRWAPLVLALEWAESHPDETPPRPTEEILKEFFTRLAKPS